MSKQKKIDLLVEVEKQYEKVMNCNDCPKWGRIDPKTGGWYWNENDYLAAIEYDIELPEDPDELTAGIRDYLDEFWKDETDFTESELQYILSFYSNDGDFFEEDNPAELSKEMEEWHDYVYYQLKDGFKLDKEFCAKTDEYGNEYKINYELRKMFEKHRGFFLKGLMKTLLVLIH